MNTQVTSEIRDAFKINSGVQAIPNPIPVVEVGLKLTKTALCVSANSTDSTAQTLLPANANADIYIIGATMSVSKDVTSTSTLSNIVITDEYGATKNLLAISTLSLTVANALNASISLNHPIKIKRNTAVTYGGTTSVSTIRHAVSLYYYIDELSNA